MLDKSKCKCWNCGELGHISTDCTKKKVRLLKEISNLLEYDGKEVYMVEKSEDESE